MFKVHDRDSVVAAERTTASESTPSASPEAPPSTAAEHESPHEASRYDAGTGQGTISRMPTGETIDHPVLDGATETDEAQRSTENPFRGRRDPSLGEWNYSHAHAEEDDLENEPELRHKREAEEAAHANDLEPRHWYKYDPGREERNRLKRGDTGPTTAM